MAVTDVERLATGAGRRGAGDRPVLMAAIGALCISASAVLVELAASGAATTAFFRCALALPLLVPLALREQRRFGARTRNARLAAAAAGVFFAIDLVLWTHAINEVGAGIATVLGNLQVVFVATAAWLLFGERPTRRLVLALPVVFAGVVLVSGLAGRPSFGGHPVAGIAFGIGTSIAYALFLLILRGATGSPHVAGPLVDATASSAVASLALGGIFGTLDLVPGWRALGWLMVLAVTSQTIGWMFITSSLPRLPRAISSLMLLLQPVAALGLATVVLSQRPTLVQLLGAVLICGGVLSVARRVQAIPGGSGAARRPPPAWLPRPARRGTAPLGRRRGRPPT
jgi:drug/metabolite transporter (DMT)-like permease